LLHRQAHRGVHRGGQQRLQQRAGQAAEHVPGARWAVGVVAHNLSLRCALPHVPIRTPARLPSTKHCTPHARMRRAGCESCHQPAARVPQRATPASLRLSRLSPPLPPCTPNPYRADGRGHPQADGGPADDVSARVAWAHVCGAPTCDVGAPTCDVGAPTCDVVRKGVSKRRWDAWVGRAGRCSPRRAVCRRNRALLCAAPQRHTVLPVPAPAPSLPPTRFIHCSAVLQPEAPPLPPPASPPQVHLAPPVQRGGRVPMDCAHGRGWVVALMVVALQDGCVVSSLVRAARRVAGVQRAPRLGRAAASAR
jgi:hypothetical protein